VESPEIYTRERLVNDRYDQDFWLHDQLHKLDETTRLIRVELTDHASIGVIGGNKPTITSTRVAPEENSQKTPHTMTFEQDFRIRSAVRDSIRQLVLENMLDDRHDLTGNSVYGLKFDTTIIPGDNTQVRAFVRVTLEVIDPFNIDTTKLAVLPAGIKKDDLLPHVQSFYTSSELKVFESPDSVLYGAHNSYKNWLDNIEDRLKLYLSKKFKSDGTFAVKCQNALQKNEVGQVLSEVVLESIVHVLGDVGKSDIFTPNAYNSVSIMLPKPWSQYMVLEYAQSGNKEAGNIPPNIDVGEKWDQVFIFDGDSDIQASNDKA
jgi:hypothetical protein